MELTPKATDGYIDIEVGVGGIAAFAAKCRPISGHMTKITHGGIRRAAFAIGLEQIVRQVEP